MRIDAHVHYTPPSLAENLNRLAEAEPYWGLLLAPASAGHTVQGWATPERMIEDMDRAGLDRVVLQGEYRLKHESCVARNNQSLEILRRWPDRVMAFACIQPRAGQAALDELKRCLDGGMRGVGELNPYAQGHAMDDVGFLRLVEACAQDDVLLNLHVSEAVGHYYPGKSATPLLDYYHLACQYPELRLILAHWGGGLMFYEIMPEVRRVLKNVWYDTAASPLLYPTAAVFNVALQCIDHRKILYGSDYPLLICPRKQREPDFRPFLTEIDSLGLAPDVSEDILGNNAAQLFGLLEAGEDRGANSLGQRQAPRGATASGDRAPANITEAMSVTAVAALWPETCAVFERHGISWRDCPVPFWEPIAQAAAVRGYGPPARRRLLDELNEAIRVAS
jgi:predicted TIM-barrel fold metal-dependent hydrolase